MPRSNEEVAELLDEWAELLAVSGSDPFRVRAYEKAARAIGGYSHDIRTLSEKDLLRIPSVGSSMATRVREYLETGQMRELEDLREMVPAGLRQLMRIPGLGPKRAIQLHRALGISTVDELVEAVNAQKLRGVKGFGPKTEENVIRAVQNVGEGDRRVLINEALDTAEMIIATLREQAGVETVTYAGSLRRMRDSIGDVDLLVASSDGPRIMEVFCSMPRARQVLAHGDTKSSIVTRKGLQVDLRVLPPEAWGAGLIYFTGSKAHNIRIREIAIKKGYKLSEWGLFEAETGRLIVAATEEDVYDALGLPWIPPTLREDRGEIEAALAGKLPSIVNEADLRGDLHSHTNMTDGVASLEEMVAAAAARGYRYYAVTDHAENLSMTGVGREKMLEQRAQIRALQRRYPKMTLLHGSELNIGRDGTVDYDPAFLAGYDVLVASVHSLFRLSRHETTARLIAAMENPLVNVIGHPSGRLIGRRDPIDFDFDAVCAAAVRTGTALEVNCFPDRMDLRDEHVRWAIERGVTIAIDTDAHSPRDLMNLRFGIGTAQRGWATAADVLNARTLKQVQAFVARKRKR